MSADFRYLFQGESVYLDHNATTPISASVAAKVPDWLGSWGNASSIHWAGRNPKALVRESRRALAQALHCDSLEIVFTSGGSEANNYALRGLYGSLTSNLSLSTGRPLHFVSTTVEHPSVLKTLSALRAKGVKVTLIPVDREGALDLEFYKEVLKQKVDLVSVMFANNETGHVFPIREMAKLAHEAGALFHSDMVQALGKSAIDLKELGVDMASFSGHKFYSLKGLGFLYVKKGLQLENLIFGGAQERQRRAGTENVLAIASMGEMARQINLVPNYLEKTQKLREHFETRLLQEISGAQVLGAQGNRLPNTTSALIPGVDGETLLMNLDMLGFAVSTGAACSSGNPEPSPVLLAMGLSREEAQSSLRVSLGWGNTQKHIDDFIEALKSVVERLRSFQEGGKTGYGIV